MARHSERRLPGFSFFIQVTIALTVNIADGFSRFINHDLIRQDLQDDLLVCAAVRQVLMLQKMLPEAQLYSPQITMAGKSLLEALGRADAALLAPRVPTDPARNQDTDAENLRTGRPGKSPEQAGQAQIQAP